MSLGRALLRPLRKRFRRVFPSPLNLSSAAYTPSGIEWEEQEEPLHKYDLVHGGYRPVAIGHVLGGRYTVIRKLGWGVYSTVWLVQDHRSVIQPLYATLKVMSEGATQRQGHLFCELEYQKTMRERSRQHSGFAHVVHMLDYSYEDDRHGRHLCLVMEPLLENLHSFAASWNHSMYPPPLLRVVGRQIALGLQFLHEECNIVHTVSPYLKDSNILLVPPGEPDAFFKRALLDQEYIPGSSFALAPDGSRIPRVRSDPLIYPTSEDIDVCDLEMWRNVQVKIGDVGADKTKDHYTELIQPVGLRAPEVVLGAEWGPPADVWSFGCTMYQLYMGKSLLNPSIGDMSVPTLHALLFGQYPTRLVERETYSHFFNPDGTLKYPYGDPMPFEKPILRRSESDAAQFVDFLRATFARDPDERATCRDLLVHPWLDP
ncbi:kinase-like protein [Trametes maxima]|nr:kinase-like protein [Trametes maxima]